MSDKPILVRIQFANTPLLKQIGLGGRSKTLAISKDDTAGSVCEQLVRHAVKGLNNSQQKSLSKELGTYALIVNGEPVVPTGKAHDLLHGDKPSAVSFGPVQKLNRHGSTGSAGRKSSRSKSGSSDKVQPGISSASSADKVKRNKISKNKRLSIRVGLKDFSSFTSGILKSGEGAHGTSKEKRVGVAATSIGEDTEEIKPEGLILYETLPNVQSFSDALSLMEIEDAQAMAEQVPDLCRIADKSGWTPLHSAMRSGLLDFSTFLIQRGASLSAKNRSGTTPLHYLFSYNFSDTKEVTKFLDQSIERLGYLNFEERNNEGNTCLHYAVEGTDGKLLPYLLNRGLDPNVVNKLGVTPLLMAIYKKNFGALNVLLDNGADMWIKTKAGESALQAAKESQSEKMYELVKRRYEEKRLTQLRNIVDEIIKTESDYVKYLRVTIDIFREPLKKEMHLSTRAIRALFANIDEVLDGSQKLLSDLMPLRNVSPDKYTVGKHFLKNKKNLEPLLDYCANKSSADESLKIVLQDEALLSWFATTHKRPELKQQDIESYLIKPMQRMCRYPLLLRELQKYTTNENEKTNLKEAIDVLNDIAARANEVKRKVDEESAVLRSFEHLASMSSRTRLVTQLKCQLVDTAVRNARTGGEVLLFNDRLIVAKTLRKGGYRRKAALVMLLADETPIIWDMPDDDNLQYAFSVVRQSSSNKVTILCESAKEKSDLLKLIHNHSSNFLQPNFELPVYELAPITPDELFAEGMKNTVRKKYDSNTLKSAVRHRELTPAQKRLRLATLLMNSEKNYVGTLKDLIQLKEISLAEGVDRQLVDRVLGKVNGLERLSSPLAEQLGDRVVVNWTSEQLVAVCFVKVLPFLRAAYENYGQNCAVAVDDSRDLVSAAPAVADHVGTLESTRNCTLAELLYRPVVRVRVYKLLLRNLLDLTMEDHPDYRNLSRCADAFDSLYSLIEARCSALQRKHPALSEMVKAAELQVKECVKQQASTHTSSALVFGDAGPTKRSASEEITSRSNEGSAGRALSKSDRLKSAGKGNVNVSELASVSTMKKGTSTRHLKRNGSKIHSGSTGNLLTSNSGGLSVSDGKEEAKVASPSRSPGRAAKSAGAGLDGAPVRFLHEEAMILSKEPLMPTTDEIQPPERHNIALLSNSFVYASSKLCKRKNVLNVGEKIPLELVWFSSSKKGITLCIPGYRLGLKIDKSSSKKRWLELLESAMEQHLNMLNNLVDTSIVDDKGKDGEKDASTDTPAMAKGSNESLSSSKEGEKMTVYGDLRFGSCAFTWGGQAKGWWNQGLLDGRGILEYQGNRFLGSFRRGILDGQGECTYFNGDRYIGSWKANQPNGEGRFESIGGDVFEGIFAGGERKSGRQTMNNGTVYEGGFKSNLFHGEGVLTRSDGFKYTGNFRFGLFHGAGTLIDADGSKYVGNFEDGLRHGKGELNYASGQFLIYQGEWARNTYHGHGTLLCRDKKSQYTGDFIMGLKEGRGLSVLPSGATYNGQYKQNVPHGKGTFTSAHGDVYKGNWKSGQKSGAGVLTLKSGAVFDGQWINDMRNGQFKIKLKNGERLTASYRNDRADPASASVILSLDSSVPRLYLPAFSL